MAILHIRRRCNSTVSRIVGVIWPQVSDIGYALFEMEFIND